MDKVLNFLDKYFSLITVILLILILSKTCGTQRKITMKLDSLKNNMITEKDLQIEGLKVEKRMIQSTDRKILDVNRQSEIDKEIEKFTSPKNQNN